MNIGDKFRYKPTGSHWDCTLIILHDPATNSRYLYNIDFKVKQGVAALLYAEYIGKASKDEIKKIYSNIKTDNK